MEYSRRESEKILEVRKKYTQFIYYHCVDIYNHIYIFILFLSFELKIEWRKQKVLRYEQIKAIQGTLLGFFMEQVIDPRARTTVTLKNSYLVAKRLKVRVTRNPKDMRQGFCDFIMYIFHACTTSWNICIYIVSYILVCYLCIMFEQNLIRIYMNVY